MQSTVVRLPAEEDMMHRLIEIRNIDHLKEHFYPQLCAHAGNELTPAGVALMLIQEFTDFSERRPTFAYELQEVLSLFVDALTDDPALAAEAKQCVDMSFAL